MRFSRAACFAQPGPWTCRRNPQVEFEPRLVEIDPDVADSIRELAKTDPGLAAIYEVLSRRHNSGQHDIAERHNEHQP